MARSKPQSTNPGAARADLTVPAHVSNEYLDRPVDSMQLETKYVRLRTPVTLGSRFGD